MANVVLPTFPALAAGAVFIKGVANNGGSATTAQYVTFAHSFQIGALTEGQGLAGDFGAGTVPCQVDAKTRYQDGSAAHALITVEAPAIAAGATLWGQFSPAAPPPGSALSLSSALGSTTLSLSMVPTALPDWVASNSTPVGALIQPTIGNAGGYAFQYYLDNGMGVSDTTGTTEPAWPQTVGTSVTDGGVTWYNVGINISATLEENLISLVSGSTDLWLSGPLAVQGRAHAVLYGALRVQVDLTAYADGTISADVVLANDIVSTITSGQPVFGGTLAYTAKLTLNGAVAYTSPALMHNLYENWTWQVGTIPHFVNTSQDNVLQIIHDPNDFIAAQAAQSYDTTLGVAATVADSTSPLQFAQGFIGTTGFAQPFTNISFSNSPIVDYGMSGVGGRPDIGLNDAWTVFWFTTQNSTFQAISFECGKINGGVPWHFWNPETGAYITTDDQPYLWATGIGQTAYPYTAQYGGLTLFAQVTADADWDLDPAHFPDLVYLDYLLTGRRYFLDELNAVTAWVETSCAPGWAERNYAQGLIMRYGQVRATAWGLRNIVNAIYANPDGTTQKLYFRSMLDNNLYWFLTQIGTYQSIQGNDCFGWYPSWNYGAALAAWEEGYLSSSLAMAAIMGHPIALLICQWQANFFVGLFSSGTNDPPTGFPPADAVVYDLAAFQFYGGSMNSGQTPYCWGSQYLPFQNWAALESLTQESGRSNISNGEVVWFEGTDGGSGSYGDYGQLLWITFANYITLGQEGATAALNTLQTMTAADGTNAPYIDPVSWAEGPLTQLVPRTLNGSQILPFAAASSAGVINANPVVGQTLAAGSFANGVASTLSVSGAAMVGVLEAAGVVSVVQGVTVNPLSIVSASGTAGSATVGKPAGGWNIGNWLIAVVCGTGSTAIPPTPSGWTLVDGLGAHENGNSVGTSILALQLSTAGPGSYSFQNGAESGACCVLVAEYSSAHVSGVDSCASAYSAASTITWPAVTTANANEVVLLVTGACYIYPAAPPSGYIQEIEAEASYSAYAWLGDAVQVGAGSTGTPSASSSASGNVWTAFTVALLPTRGSASLAGAVVIDALRAAGRLGLGPIPLTGATNVGRVVADCALGLPPYSELAASLSVTVSQLQSALTTIEQWQAAMATEATAITAVLAGLT
ncbi:MAG TPA: hypothetical protein VMF62_05385 [Acetobacteraceae bacterium]|nr:hypothetical protein [Acetobacteraceae bacterium]